MSHLLKYRENLNLTQEQLAEKTNISVRTIQRIEAGQEPKGHTLDTLSKALGISREELLKGDLKQKEVNFSLIKLINLSSLLLIPLIIMYWKKEVNSITKQIVSIQILWTLSLPFILFLVIFLVKWQSLSTHIVPLIMLLLLLANVYIIIRNAVEIDKKKKLYIKLWFSFL
jgi:transcriptional regulator with XRE-family HTH domain